jgi:hypothetical protein
MFPLLCLLVATQIGFLVAATGGTSFIVASDGTPFSFNYQVQPIEASLNIASQVAATYPPNANGCAAVRAPVGCKVTFTATLMNTESNYDFVSFYSSLSPDVLIRSYSGRVSPASSILITAPSNTLFICLTSDEGVQYEGLQGYTLATNCVGVAPTPTSTYSCGSYTGSGCTACTSLNSCVWCGTSVNSGTCNFAYSASTAYCSGPFLAIVPNDCVGQAISASQSPSRTPTTSPSLSPTVAAVCTSSTLTTGGSFSLQTQYAGSGGSFTFGGWIYVPYCPYTGSGTIASATISYSTTIASSNPTSFSAQFASCFTFDPDNTQSAFIQFPGINLANGAISGGTTTFTGTVVLTGADAAKFKNPMFASSATCYFALNSNTQYLLQTVTISLTYSIAASTLTASTTPTPSPTASITPTRSNTPTISQSTSLSSSLSLTPSITPSPSGTVSLSATPSPSNTPSKSASASPLVAARIGRVNFAFSLPRGSLLFFVDNPALGVQVREACGTLISIGNVSAIEILNIASEPSGDSLAGNAAMNKRRRLLGVRRALQASRTVFTLSIDMMHPAAASTYGDISSSPASVATALRLSFGSSARLASSFAALSVAWGNLTGLNPSDVITGISLGPIVLPPNFELSAVRPTLPAATIPAVAASIAFCLIAAAIIYLRRPQVFISHAWGQELKDQHGNPNGRYKIWPLVYQVYRALKRRGYRVWLDRRGGMGHDIDDSMKDGIARSVAVVAVVTLDYAHNVHNGRLYSLLRLRICVARHVYGFPCARCSKLTTFSSLPQPRNCSR